MTCFASAEREVMLRWVWEAVAGSYPGWSLWRQADPDDLMEEMTLGKLGAICPRKNKKDKDEKERKCMLRTAVRIQWEKIYRERGSLLLPQVKQPTSVLCQSETLQFNIHFTYNLADSQEMLSDLSLGNVTLTLCGARNNAQRQYSTRHNYLPSQSSSLSAQVASQSNTRAHRQETSDLHERQR